MHLDLKLSADSVFLRLFPEKGHTLALCFPIAAALLSVHTSCY